MAHTEIERLEATEKVLKEAGFEVSERCHARPSCFDFAARKNEKVILIKVQADLDTFSSDDSFELDALSKCVSAATLLVAENTREKPLEDDTVYSRYNIWAVTPKTFGDITIRGVNPIIQAGPGGYYVGIDCQAIKRRRQELGLSVGGMAERIGISRRTLYGYERGMAKASVTAAYNLIWALAVPVAKSVDVFEKSDEQRKCFLMKAKHAIERHRLLQKILNKLSRCNITTVKKAPFDFVINIPEEKTRIIGGLTNDKEKQLDRRVEEILSVSKIVKAHPILVTEGQELVNKDILCINGEEFSRIKDPADLITKL
jgi:putative transcriptional regulator